MAEQVFVLCDNGSVMPHDLPLPVGIADRVAKGHLRLVNEDGSPIEEAPAPPAVPEPTEPEADVPPEDALDDGKEEVDVETETFSATSPDKPPAVNAAKPEWVAFAVAQGMGVGEADGMTKAELIEQFGKK